MKSNKKQTKKGSMVGKQQRSRIVPIFFCPQSLVILICPGEEIYLSGTLNYC